MQKEWEMFLCRTDPKFPLKFLHKYKPSPFLVSYKKFSAEESKKACTETLVLQRQKEHPPLPWLNMTCKCCLHHFELKPRRLYHPQLMPSALLGRILTK